MIASRSAELASRIACFRSGDVPPEVRRHARRCLLDTLGAMLAAAAPRYPAGRIVMEQNDEVRAKFQAVTAGVVPAARAAAIVRAVEAIEGAPDLRRLTSLLRAPTRRRR